MTRIPRSILLLSITAVAPFAATLPYQGLATDAKGNPLKDSSYMVGFALYGTAASASSSWSEQQLVTTHKGLFSVQLGAVQAIPDSLVSNTPYFLGVTFGSGAELSPRLQLAVTPWASRAGKADTSTFSLATQGLDSLRQRIQADSIRIDALSRAHVQDSTSIAAILGLLKGATRTGSELYFDSLNLHVRNGLGRTDTANGLGNVVIGYNELRQDATDARTGSHMLVVGKSLSYSSYGGIVAGWWNSTSGSFASVAGGQDNRATGGYSAILGGAHNQASGQWATVGGGQENASSGQASAVLGGLANFVSGSDASASGGAFNSVLGDYSSITGGYSGTTNGL
jgi:hypothetical protein